MKKLLFLVILFILISIGCGSFSSTNLKIINNSDYALLDVNFHAFNRSADSPYGSKISAAFGTIDRKKASSREIEDEYWPSYDYAGYIIFKLIASNGNIISCETSMDIRINKRKNEYTINNNTIVEHSDNKRNAIIDIAGPPKTAVFTIYNMTYYDFTNVEYDSVVFGSIKSGKDSRKYVSSGTNFIYFNIQTKSGTDYRCSTEPFTCTKGNNTEYISNHTSVTIVGGETTRTVKYIYDNL